jgi:(p)ppGpp synthase/HD superfamily hydrolase
MHEQSTLTIAQSIAIEAHAGQRYDQRDYIEAHVAPIAGMVARMGYDKDYQSAAWLHDVVEDSPFTNQDLTDRGVPLHVVHAVDLLTKRPGVPHEQYMAAIASDPLATVVKFADSSLNYANTIFYGDPVTARFRKRVATYSGNIAFLQPLLPPPAHQ